MLSISCQDIEEFSEFSHDINPLHINEDYARKTPFGHCVVYGILGILKMLDKILADNQEQGIFIESIQYKFNSPIRENKDYQLVKVESSEGDWQLCDSNQILVELKFQYSSCAFRKAEIEKNSISYLKIAANSNDVDLANINYKEDYALHREAWASFLERHSNLARVPLEQLTCLVWTSYCIGMRSPGRQALYMGGKINFSQNILNGNYSCSKIECSVVTNNWDSNTGSLVLDAEIKANNQAIAKVNLDSLKRPDSLVISMETLASNWDKIPTNHWLRDQVCLVTGGSRGLGSAIAKTLALFGAVVAINYRSSDEEASKVLQEIEINGGKAALFKGDIATPGICQQIVEEIIKKYGSLNLVINNAHPFIDSVIFDDLDFERFQNTVITPLQISFEVTKAVINELQKRKGMMVTISSIYVQKPEKGFSSYVSAKNAVEGLIRSLAVEFPQVNQLIYRPNKFLSDQTITNFSQIHLQSSVEVVKDLWIGLDKLQSESINPLIFNQVDAKDIQAVSEVKETDKPKIAIAATFTAEPIEESLNFWLQELKINSQVEFAAYNQVFQELLDPNSLFANNNQGINVILIRFEDWQRFEDTTEEKSQTSELNPDKIRQNTQDLITALKSAAENSATPYLMIVCPGSPLVAASSESQNLFQEMENLLESEINHLSSVYLIKSSAIFKTYPVENYYDASGDKLGHIPFTNLFYTSLGTLISRKIYTLKNPPYKVIVLDCDRTIWQGICGEDGAMGIKIDGPWKILQEFMVAQYQAGMLICLCSKNVEADVIEVFEKRPEMPLKREHIVSWRINWQPKSENIQSLAAELNLGLDSFIFIDDNPVECSEVQLNCPQVLTLQVPEKSEDIPRFLNHIWAFDRLKITKEDKKRTESYKQNIQRESLRSNSFSFQDFLEKLNLKIDITPMEPSQLARVSQLTQRTNQFNATTIRRSETEIKTLCQSENYECLTVEVKDRFGDYGLVGAIIFQLKENSLIVDTFLLSCRVLGRGVEYQMLAELGKIADKNQLAFVNFAYIPSAKNEPLLNFINNVGEKFAQPENDGFIYHFPTDFVKELTYKPATSNNNGEKNQQTISTSKDTNFSVDRQSKSTQLSRIANELYSAEQIIQVIESQKHNSRKLEQTYVSPRSKTEQELVDLWTKLFNIDRIGINDNFFDLGGNSLVAVRLFSQIEEKFNKSFPLSIMLKAPTVEKLAQLIEQKEQNIQQSLLLPIQVGSPEKTPFFAVHGGFGDVLYYQELAKEIGSDQPFYGIQPLGLDGKSSPLAKVEDMAAEYVKEIRTMQPVGPYYLGGMCMGGIIALEIAQQLQTQNEEVGFLAVLDPPHPRPMSFLRYCQISFDYYFQHYFYISFNYHTRQLLKLSPQEKVSYLLEQINKLTKKITSKFVKVNSKKVPSKTKIVNSQKNNSQKKQVAANNNNGSNNSTVSRIKNSPQGAKNKVFESNMRALRSYSPSHYSGIVTLFVAEESLKKQVDSSQTAWENLVTGKVETYVVPGSHRTMMKKPFVYKLAEQLRLDLKHSNDV